jgi:hypothetical protein
LIVFEMFVILLFKIQEPTCGNSENNRVVVPAARWTKIEWNDECIIGHRHSEALIAFQTKSTCLRTGGTPSQHPGPFQDRVDTTVLPILPVTTNCSLVHQSQFCIFRRKKRELGMINSLILVVIVDNGP